jgi:hypothetical protein
MEIMQRPLSVAVTYPRKHEAANMPASGAADITVTAARQLPQ